MTKLTNNQMREVQGGADCTTISIYAAPGSSVCVADVTYCKWVNGPEAWIISTCDN